MEKLIYYSTLSLFKKHAVVRLAIESFACFTDR